MDEVRTQLEEKTTLHLIQVPYVMVRTRDRVSTRYRNPRGRGDNDAEAKPRSLLHHSHLDTRVSEPRRDEVELSNRLRTDDAKRQCGMESSRQAELAASGVISPCVLASLHDLFPVGFARHKFQAWNWQRLGRPICWNWL